MDNTNKVAVRTAMDNIRLTDRVADLELEVVELKKYKEMWNNPASLHANLLRENKLTRQAALHLAGATDYAFLSRVNVMLNILTRAVAYGMWKIETTSRTGQFCATQVDDVVNIILKPNLVDIVLSDQFKETLELIATDDEKELLNS